jgi:hypothetical protein
LMMDEVARARSPSISTRPTPYNILIYTHLHFTDVDQIFISYWLHGLRELTLHLTCSDRQSTNHLNSGNIYLHQQLTTSILANQCIHNRNSTRLIPTSENNMMIQMMIPRHISQ